MCLPAIAMVAVTAFQMYSQYQQGVATNNYYKSVAQQQEQQAKLDYARGEKQAELDTIQAKYAGKNQAEKSTMVSSSQRAAMVANGVDLSSVTAEDVASDSWSKAETDEMAIRYNADINNWSTMEDAKYKRWAGQVNAANSKQAGKNAMNQAYVNMGSTLLSSAASMYGAGMFAKAGTPAIAGQGGYLAGTPAGARNMGTWTKF